jgi:hypothetical protein
MTANGARPASAAPRPLSTRDRGLAADAIDGLCCTVDQLATWLWSYGTEDDERAAELLRDAWTRLAAAGWRLDRPPKPRSGGWLSG